MGKQPARVKTLSEVKTIILNRLLPGSPKRGRINSRASKALLIGEIVSDDYEEHYAHGIVDGPVFDDLGKAAVNNAGMWY